MNKAQKTVRNLDASEDLQSKSTALVADTSTTLATILGEAVSANARGVEIYVTGTGSVHYSPSGAATTGNGIIPQTKTIWGAKGTLDKVQFIGSSGDTPTINAFVFGDK